MWCVVRSTSQVMKNLPPSINYLNIIKTKILRITICCSGRLRVYSKNVEL